MSDLDTIEIRTNFTSLSPKLYTVTLDDLAADAWLLVVAVTHHPGTPVFWMTHRS